MTCSCNDIISQKHKNRNPICIEIAVYVWRRWRGKRYRNALPFFFPLENIVVSVRSAELASDTPCFLPCRTRFIRPRRRSCSKPAPFASQIGAKRVQISHTANRKNHIDRMVYMVFWLITLILIQGCIFDLGGQLTLLYTDMYSNHKFHSAFAF